MAIKWSQVIQKPEFLDLSYEEQEETRQMYFEDVVVPQVDPTDIEEARTLFDEDTRIQAAAPDEDQDLSFAERAVGSIPGVGPALVAGGRALGITGEDVAAQFTGAVEGAAAGLSALPSATMSAAEAALQRHIGEGDPDAEPTDPTMMSGLDIMSGAGAARLHREQAQQLGVPETLAQSRAESQREVQELMPEALRGRTFEENITDPETAGLAAAWGVTSNLGPTAVIGASGLAAGAAGGPMAAIGVAGTLAYQMEAGESYAELKELGVPEAQAQAMSGAVGAVNAALEIAPLGYAAKNIPGVRKLIKAKVGDILKADPTLIVKMMGAEGGTEAIQSITGNAAKMVYDENQELLEGVTEAAFIGAATGGIIGGAGMALPTPKRTEADIAADADKAKADLATDIAENVVPEAERFLSAKDTGTIASRSEAIKGLAADQVTDLENEIHEVVPEPIATEVEIEEIEAAPPPGEPAVDYGDMRGMTMERALKTLTEGHDEGTLRMTPDEFNALVEDIKENGIREPITLETGIRPGELTLTDGRHRLLAAKAAGLKAVPVTVDPEAAPVDAVPEVTLEPEAVEAPVADEVVPAVPTHSANEVARPKAVKSRLAAKYREIGGRRDEKTKGWVFRSVDRKRVERADQIFGESDVVAKPEEKGSFQTYMRERGFEGQKLASDEMRAVRSDYRASLQGQRPQVQAGPSDLTTKDSAVDRLRYIFQDKFLDLKRVEEVAGPGRKPYRAETLYHGRAAARVDDIETSYVDPVTDILAKHKIDLQDLNYYMWALHAPEANAELKARNPDRAKNEALSGMSDARAADIVAKWKGNEGMQQAAEFIRDMNDATADIIETEGLEPSDVVQDWRDTKPNYVPLHRVGKKSKAGKGRGLSVRGKEAQARVGSEGEVENIVAHSVEAHSRAIQRAEKNRVGLEILNFARENPDPNFWKIDPIETVTRLDPKTGLVTTMPDPSYQLAPNVLHVKEDGQTHHITFNEDNPVAVRLAEALNNLDSDQGGKAFNYFRMVNRYLSAMSTTYNPEFMLSNFFRDLQTAGIKMEATEAKGMQKAIVRDLFPAMRTIWRQERGKGETDLSRYHEEWRHEGGKTGWIDARTNIEDRVKDLQKTLESKTGEGTGQKMANVYRGLKKYMEDANSAVENGVRLSAYISARRLGVSKEDAAALSKELTVNFNRKGSAGPGMNAAYLFYNAGVQGSANVIGSLKSKRVQKLVAGITVGAMANAVLQRAVGGEDDDGVQHWDKIGEWEKERNLVIMNPFSDEGDYFKIPLPYGYNIFKVFGENVVDSWYRDDYNFLDGAAAVTKAAIGSFNPVGSDASFLQALSPTVADPFVMIGENKTFYGSPLRPENRYGADKARSELYFRSARDYSVATAKALNKLTGGTKYRSGVVDISPEEFDLMIDFVLGGVGKTVGNTVDTLGNVMTGDADEVRARRVPGVRRFYSGASETWTPQTYFEYKNDVVAFEAEAKDAAKGGEDLARFRQDPRAGLIKGLKAVESALRVAYKGRDKLEAAQPDGWEDKVKMVEDKIEFARKRFIVKYRQTIWPEEK